MKDVAIEFVWPAVRPRHHVMEYLLWKYVYDLVSFVSGHGHGSWFAETMQASHSERKVEGGEV